MKHEIFGGALLYYSVIINAYKTNINWNTTLKFV